MIASVEQIVKMLENWAPERYAEEWDNVGWMIGSKKRVVNKILVALEIDESVVEEAIEKSVDLIVTHHPFIFKSLKQISDEDSIGKCALRLIQNQISVYSAHTNLDSAKNGINDYLCQLMNIKNTTPIVGIDNEESHVGMGRIGFLDQPTTCHFFLESVKAILDLEQVTFAGKSDSKINKIGICSGAGSEFIKMAKAKGCDLYLTGDIKYHDYRLALELGLNIADITHFNSENIYMPYWAENIQLICEEKNYDVKIVESKVLKQPFTYL